MSKIGRFSKFFKAFFYFDLLLEELEEPLLSQSAEIWHEADSKK